MVVYHSLNYSTQYYLSFKYLAFLPPSFIFITGFLIARVYFQRSPGSDRATSHRMVVRGIKLLAIFTALNVLATFVATRDYNGQSLNLPVFFSLWREIYFQGAGYLVAFDILIPIAYILLIGPLLLWLSRLKPWIVPTLAIIAMTSLVLSQAFGHEITCNVSMMAAGLIGASFGIIPQSMLNALSRFWFLPLAIYATLAVVGFRYNAFAQWILAQQAAAVIAVAALFALGNRFRKPEWLMDRIVVLGNYSLLAYITQIGFLQILVRWTGRFEPNSFAFLAFFLVILALTVLSSEMVHWCRTRSPLANNVYRFVFG